MAETYFPKERAAIELRRVEGRVLRLLVLERAGPVRHAPYYDFPQPLDDVPKGPITELSYFPRTVVRTTTSDERFVARRGQQASPFITWSRFADAAAFDQHVEQLGARLTDSRRQRRRLEQALGPLEFTFDDRRPAVFDTCVAWKGSQYEASGYENLFARPECIELFRQLRRRRVLVVNSLFAGERLVAAHLGALSDQRFAWWVPAYDTSLGKYSPGRLLLEDTLHASQALGHLEFDFLVGNEPYKFQYATHNRIIGALGTPTSRERVLMEARVTLTRALSRRPEVRALLSELWARAARFAPRA